MGHGEHGSASWKLFWITGTPARKQPSRCDSILSFISKKLHDNLRSHPHVGKIIRIVLLCCLSLGVNLIEEHLREVRCLRQRLEESIRTNERLRQQLEERLAKTGRDGGTITRFSNTNTATTITSFSLRNDIK